MTQKKGFKASMLLAIKKNKTKLADLSFHTLLYQLQKECTERLF